jgi:hypothetical protein
VADDDSHVELRGSPRRWVMLQARIEDSSRVSLTTTVNVSASGILVELPEGLELQTGDRVSVVIEGMLADDDTAESKRGMAVVRVDEHHLALRFTEAD